MTRFVVVGIRGLVRLDEHDVVEFQPFHLANVRHVDAGPKRKILIRDAAQMRRLGLGQAAIVEIRLFRIPRDDGDGRERLLLQKPP